MARYSHYIQAYRHTDVHHVQHTAEKTSTAKKRKSRIAAISVTLANCCQKEGPAINTVYLLASLPPPLSLPVSHSPWIVLFAVPVPLPWHVAIAIVVRVAVAQMRITYTPSGSLAACLTVSPQLSLVCICLALHFIRDSFPFPILFILLSDSPGFFYFSHCTYAQVQNETKLKAQCGQQGRSFVRFA